jgi:hypothetical protein
MARARYYEMAYAWIVRAAWLLCLLVASCGRRGFEPQRDLGADAASIIGCADGEREAFVDVRFVDIAGCAATWTGTPSLRAARTGTACGDDLGGCAVPADACDVGWHVCGDAGDPLDLSTRISGAECANPGGVAGRYVAALGHCVGCANMCTGGEPDCVYGASYECPSSFISCSEPVCCGSMCTFAGNCHAGVFAAPGTRIGFAGRACGALTGDSQAGILCCRD